MTAIPRAQLLSESDNEVDIMESDPLLEIKRIHAAIDKRVEWFKCHRKVDKHENRQN